MCRNQIYGNGILSFERMLFWKKKGQECLFTLYIVKLLVEHRVILYFFD